MGICRQCAWYREANGNNNPVQVLAGLANSADPEVAKKLDELESKESVKLDAERQEVKLKECQAMGLLSQIGGNFNSYEVPENITQEQVRQTFGAFPILFEGEPTCVAHCAAPLPASPGQNVWSIPTLRNWAQFCKEFRPAERRRDCVQCVHYIPSKRDKEDAEDIAKLLQFLSAPGARANNLLNDEISRRQSSIGPEKACQLEQAYSSNGNVRSHLSYLPYCRERQGVPELLNRFADCKSFAARQGAEAVAAKPTAGGPRVQRTASPGAPPAGIPVTATLQPMPSKPLDADKATVLEQSGVRLFGGCAPADSLLGAVFETAISSGTDAVRTFLFEGMARQASTNVEDDYPPLTHDMLRRSLAAAAVAYGRSLSRAEQDKYVRFVQEAWQRNETQAIEAQLAMIADASAIRQPDARRHLQAFISACGLDRVGPGRR